MATYVIVFKKPKNPGEMTPPEDKKPITSIKDYHDITRVFRSKLIASGKAICTHSVNGDETELIYDKTLENKKKVCFTGIKFTGNSLRREVPADHLDKDTVVYFIDREEVLQNVIDKVSDGDVISLIDSVEISAPLKCEGKKIQIDLCGCDIKCKFNGDITTSPNITIKNSITESGSISKGYSNVNMGTVYEVNPVSQSADEVIAAAAPGDIVVLPAGEYGNINITNGVTITAKYNDKEKSYDAVTLSGTITATAESGTIEINNIKIANVTSPNGTGSGGGTAKGNAINISGKCDFNMANCEIEGMTNFYNLIYINTTGLVVIDGLTIGKNNSYNEIEFSATTPVKDGTTISNCTFKEGSGAHCGISMYSYEEGAVINITNNKLDTDDNGFRFSNNNNAHATINLSDNVWDKSEGYDATSAYEAGQCSAKFYAGLFFAQQYKEDMDLSKLTINAKNNTCKGKVATKDYVENADEQLFYVYMDNKSWVLTKPTVNIIQ